MGESRRGDKESARGDAQRSEVPWPRGSRGAGPPPGASPRRGGPSSHIPPGFPHTCHQRAPKPRLFPRPSPTRAGETIFHPLLVFNLLWGKKAAFVEQGAARRAGRGRRRLCVPQLRAWGRRGGAAGARGRSAGAEGPEVEPGRGGAQGRRGAGARARTAWAGRQAGVGAAGSRDAGGRVAGAEGVEKKATRARKPIVLLALFCTRAGDWGKMDTR